MKQNLHCDNSDLTHALMLTFKAQSDARDKRLLLPVVAAG
jgi:hypothetical protein